MKISAQALYVLQGKFKNEAGEKSETPPKKDGVFVVEKTPPQTHPQTHPMNEKAFFMGILRDNLEAAREAADAQAEHFRKMRIAFKIAARIMRGDNVPQQDKDFLLEQSPGLFKLAMTARRMDNDDPEDHEALSDREDGNDDQVVAATVKAISSQHSAVSVESAVSAQ